MTKPETQLSNWKLVGGLICGTAHYSDGDVKIRAVYLRRPLNAVPGSRIETDRHIFILVGEKARV